MTFDPANAFNLAPLPPSISVQEHPDFMALMNLHNNALKEISQLEGALRDLDRPAMFLSTFYLNESISSSAVEHIYTTIESVLEDQTKPDAEQSRINKEVIHYRKALISGTTSLRQFGLSSRTIKSVHKELQISKGVPGEFRRVQNAIANRTRDGQEIKIYTPPLWNKVEDLISNWEAFAANDQNFFPLIKIAICHYQFEATHPFEDGNGRTGRILMILQMLEQELLSYPALFLSGYLSEHEATYKQLLLNITKRGEWWSYIHFMLKAFATQALKTRIGIINLIRAKKDLKGALYKLDQKPIRQNNITVVVDHLFSNPVTHAKFMERDLNIHWQTCGKYLRELTALGFLQETKSGKYKFYRNPKAFEALIVRTADH